MACYKGHIEVVRLLLANGAGADIDREDEDGDTPLADAGYEDHSDIVALLEEQLDSNFVVCEEDSDCDY